ncbi:MacB-like core domain-containing protein [Lachnospiraceae bacterium NE2001]|nr:MacB-like core domain-containing protein [Lachnospiraceae bacterium NE2001]
MNPNVQKGTDLCAVGSVPIAHERHEMKDEKNKNRIRVMAVIVAVNLLLGVVFLCVHFAAKNRTDTLYSQQAAQRWGVDDEKYAQVSIFYSENAGIGSTDVKNIRSALQKKLYEDSLLVKSEDSGASPDARTWIDAYSGHTFDDIRKDSSTVHVNVYTVGGDFFQIHNIPLKSGSYLDLESSDVNQILLDEYVAWSLFGGNNIAGMKVWIGDAVFTITGVVACDDSKAAKEAYGDYNAVYVPIEAYSKLYTKDTGSDSTTSDSESVSSGTPHQDGTVVTCYEAVLPNPIKNYGLYTVADAAGIQFKSDEEKKASRSSLDFGDKVILENSARYTRSYLYNRLKMKKYENMRTNSVVYPYWENEALYEEQREIGVLRFDIVVSSILLLSIVVIAVIFYRMIEDKVAQRKPKNYEI